MNDETKSAIAESGVAYPRILQAILSEPWAILPTAMAGIMEAVNRQVVLGMPPAEAFEPRAQGDVGRIGAGSIYAIPIHGTISKRMNMMGALSGGVSTEELSREIRAARDNPDVSQILLDIDSPGGSVYGVHELAAEIYEARQAKPVVAVANSLAASAAYYLGSQASEFIVTPSGEAGSIGVLAVHMDFSEFNEKMGVTPTYISAGRYKVEGHQDAPLDDEAHGFLQSRVDDYYNMFVETVARGRGTTTEAVREGFGQGRVLGAQSAVAEGLADSVEPFSGVVSRLTASASRAARRRQYG